MSKLTEELGKEDFEWAIGLNRTCFSFLGVWPDFNAKTNFLKASYAPVLIVYLIIFLLIPELWALILVIRNLPLVLDNLFIVCITATIKLTLYWQNKREFSDIVLVITRDWCREKSNWERDIMLKVARQGRIITISTFIFTTCTYAGLYIAPRLGIAFRQINNITDDEYRYLPVQTVYPFDVTKTPNFQLTFISQLFSGVIICICFTGTAVLFACVVFHICGQLEILAVKMNNLHISMETNDIYESSLLHSVKRIKSDISKLVNTHVHIIKTINVVEKFFRMLSLVEIINMSFLMLSFGFQFLNVLSEDAQLTFSRLLIPLSTSITITLHSFIYCLSGEVLSSYSDKLFHCFCQTEWYAFPKTQALDLLIVAQQTQIPLQLSAGKVMFLNYATFSKILKTIAGYISVLLAVKQK